MRGRAITIAIVIFVLATALRVAFVAQYRANPLFDRPIIDALTYHEWAIGIARGEGLGDGAFTRAPLYPIFLAGVYRLGGIGPETPPLELMPGAPLASHAIRNAKMMQAILGGASAALLAAAGIALFGQFVGVAAGLLFALHPLLIFYTGELFGETLAIFLTLVAFCALALARPRARAARSPAAMIAFHLLAGIALGLSAITRPTILIVVLPLPLVLLAIDWLERRGASRVDTASPSGSVSPAASRGRVGSPAPSLARAAALALGLAVAIAPVTLRNAREGGGLVLVSSQGGVNLWMGNNADADGRSARSPGRGRTATPSPAADIIDVAARQIAEQEAGRPLTAAEVSDHWGAKAKRWIASHPLDFLRLTLRKVYFFFGAAEIWDQQCDVDFLARFSPIVSALLVAQPVSLPAGLVMPLALLGLFLVARDIIARPAGHALLLWFFLPYLAGVLLFFVASRYRLPLLPFLFLLAAIALERLIDLWRTAPPRRALLHTLPLLAAAVLLNLHARYSNPLYQARARVFVANALIDPDAPERALPYLEEAMRIEPRAADPHYALGLVRLSQDDLPGARREFEETLARDPGFERAAINLANLRAQAGEWEEALALYESALAVMPGDGMILDNLAIVAREAGRGGRPDLAERALRRILVERPDDVDAMNALAWNLADRLGRPGDAVPIARDARDRAREPGKIAEIEDTLGWALFLTGDAEGALPHLRAARAALPANPDVALHLGLALLAVNASRASNVEARALLDESFAGPGGDARRARADSIIKHL